VARAGAIIRVSSCRPFKDQSVKIALRFDFDEELVESLKRILREVRQAPAETAGGWYPPLRIWFVEPCAWPEVRRRLEELGCSFQGSEADELPAPERAWVRQGPTLFEPATDASTSGPEARCRAALEWLGQTARDIEGALERGQIQGRPLDPAWLATTTAALQTAAGLLGVARLTEKAWGKKLLEMTP
jgi:hypothetical protein